MRLTLVSSIAVLALCLTAAPGSAHHSFAGEFDVDKPIKLQGTITRVEWINPHAWIHMDVKKPDGTVESWAIEGGTPNTLFRRGVTLDSVKAGMVINVDGYLARDGSNKANGRDITLPDVRKLFLSGGGANEQPGR
jgi:DNA/RNA endonuclease YhcR with UshA esterase domain